MYVSAWVCAQTCQYLILLGLDFGAPVNHLIWVLGNKLGSSARTVCALSC